MVPSLACCSEATGGVTMQALSCSLARSDPARSDIASKSVGALLVDPAEQLGRPEALLPELFAERGQPFPIEFQQIGRGHGGLAGEARPVPQRL